MYASGIIFMCAILPEGTKVQDELLDLIAGMQSKRMDEQRVALPHLPGLHPPLPSQPDMLQRLSAAGSNAPDDTFLEMLMRCQVKVNC